MQQHSGEHLISGLIHEKYGYNNVGFHMGSETITLDVDGEVPGRGAERDRGEGKSVCMGESSD